MFYYIRLTELSGYSKSMLLGCAERLRMAFCQNLTHKV